eukprot:SAG11_NODE_13181_length_666_cov_1.368607_2_plen_175_part_01
MHRPNRSVTPHVDSAHVILASRGIRVRWAVTGLVQYTNATLPQSYRTPAVIQEDVTARVEALRRRLIGPVGRLTIDNMPPGDPPCFIRPGFGSLRGSSQHEYDSNTVCPQFVEEANPIFARWWWWWRFKAREHRRLGLQFAFAGDQLGDLPPWGPMADAYVLTKVDTLADWAPYQ